MGNQSFSRIRDWVEPAHPGLLEHYADLLAIYTHLRKGLQEKIDVTFDAVSKRIGYVVTTTLPAVLEVGAGGVVRSFSLSGEHLKGTLFEERFAEVMKMPEPMLGAPGQKYVRAGTYHIYLIWYEALRLRLRRDWLEPVHLRPGEWQKQILAQRAEKLKVAIDKHVIVDPDIHEPAHWFDPGLKMEIDDLVIVSVLDEVYPDLRLAERVAFFREEYAMRIRPEVMEPAHIPPEVLEPAHFPPGRRPKPRQPGG